MEHALVKIKREGNVLKPSSIANSNLINRFRNGLEEGQMAHMYLETITDNGSLLQLAKLHVMIKQLATFTGTTVLGMKLEIKRRAGLVMMITVDGKLISHIKSFGDDCSKEDLSLAIQACIEIGEELNFILN